jgi:hypothetical protein
VTRSVELGTNGTGVVGEKGTVALFEKVSRSYRRCEVIIMTVQRHALQASAADGDGGPLSGSQLAACPACGADEFETVVEQGSADVNSFCRACGRCWHVELGFVHRITPPICFGCPERDRCEAVYAADQARAFGR